MEIYRNSDWMLSKLPKVIHQRLDPIPAEVSEVQPINSGTGGLGPMSMVAQNPVDWVLCSNQCKNVSNIIPAEG